MKFFGAEQTSETRSCTRRSSSASSQFVGLMKIFAWQMMPRNSIAREIKRLEIRIVELAKSLDK